MSDTKKLILIVDDTIANLQVVQGILKNEFELRLAKSGNMALALLDRATPDLILLDIEMPGISGFDIMEIIQSKPNLRKIPVIFITGHAEKDVVQTALQKGARGYVVKPFEPATLRAKVHSVLNIQDE